MTLNSSTINCRLLASQNKLGEFLYLEWLRERLELEDTHQKAGWLTQKHVFSSHSQFRLGEQGARVTWILLRTTLSFSMTNQQDRVDLKGPRPRRQRRCLADSATVHRHKSMTPTPPRDSVHSHWTKPNLNRNQPNFLREDISPVPPSTITTHQIPSLKYVPSSRYPYAMIKSSSFVPLLRNHVLTVLRYSSCSTHRKHTERLI